jgi:hypothetical protein
MAGEYGEVPVPVSGRSLQVKIGSLPVDVLGDITTRPAGEASDKEKRGFQSGDVLIWKHNYGYADVSFTVADKEGLADSVEAMRGVEQDITLPDFSGKGYVYISDGPKIPSDGEDVKTFAFTIQWSTTATPKA